MKKSSKWLIVIALLVTSSIVMIQNNLKTQHFKHEYGVFLNAEQCDYQKIKGYQLLVIDGQNFNSKQIKQLKRHNGKVISYLNIGSIERFRSYYPQYQHLALQVYQGWEDEYWVDVADKQWQSFIIKQVKALKAKGIEGFFIDNSDVYYHYPKMDIFNGLVRMLQQIKALTKTVILNGGDYFVKAYLHHHKSLSTIISGINQETVFSAIDFDHHRKLIKQSKTNTRYYQKYMENVKDQVDVYMLEYTKNPQLIVKINDYAQKQHFKVYIANNANLEL